MPYFIVDIGFYEMDNGLRRGCSAHNRPYATRADAETVVAAQSVERQARRAAWEREHGRPFPGEDYYIVESPSIHGTLELAKQHFGPMPGDTLSEREELRGALVQAADGYPEWADELLAAGADPNGMPLIMAIQCGELRIVQAMLAAGADPNRSFADMTPLVRAVESRYPAVVRALLEAGAAVSMRAGKDVTPLQAANLPGRRGVSASDEEEIRRMLAAAGAKA